jgi:hypothetical protein
VGTLIVTAVLGASWWVRIVLVVLVIALGAGYLIVQSRSTAQRLVEPAPAPESGLEPPR